MEDSGAVEGARSRRVFYLQVGIFNRTSTDSGGAGVALTNVEATSYRPEGDTSCGKLFKATSREREVVFLASSVEFCMSVPLRT